jgi:hypothetical protein
MAILNFARVGNLLWETDRKLKFTVSIVTRSSRHNMFQKLFIIPMQQQQLPPQPPGADQGAQ